ncbi:MAG TPA: aconitase X catalytic domain-containing protein [Candidatus Lokiarchaeia archaeon]|nr:aconitase X catalytic domain-containing protein [Candidatus Lokiarchaeia archaeon]
MDLTADEQAVLDGEQGEGFQKAMEIVVALGKIYGAQDLIPIKSAQVSGVSFKNLGEAGLEFLQEWAALGAKCTVPTTLNPAAMDLQAWEAMGIPEDFAHKQMEVIEAYEKMGVSPTCTCVPYLVGNTPDFGDHVAWAESSAVTYCNSVLGARTNREGGPSSLAAGIIGRTANYGLHLDDKRNPELGFHISANLRTDADYSVLGYIIGKSAGEKVVWLENISRPEVDSLKIFGAAIAAYGSVALYHIDGITPEFNCVTSPPDSTVISQADLAAAYDDINAEVGAVDFVAIGCPHNSLAELRTIAKLLKGKHVKVECWVLTARPIKDLAVEEGLEQIFTASGAKLLADTCMVVSPVELLGFQSIVTNSGKACFYSRSLNNLQVHIGDLKKCIEVAVSGQWN